MSKKVLRSLRGGHWVTLTIIIISINTQVNLVLSVCPNWLTWSQLAKYYMYSPPSSQREIKWLPMLLWLPKVMFWSTSYSAFSACVVYTETIIHLSVGQSGGFSPPLR